MYHKIDVSNLTVEQADEFAWVLAEELDYDVIGDSSFGITSWRITADGPCIQHIPQERGVFIRHIGRMNDVDRNNLIANVTRLFFQFGLSLAINENSNENNTNVGEFRFGR